MLDNTHRPRTESNRNVELRSCSLSTARPSGPTETESRETLDAFAAVLLKIREEDAEFLHDAPHTLGISRPDEVKAAKEPVLRWKAGA